MLEGNKRIIPIFYEEDNRQLKPTRKERNKIQHSLEGNKRNQKNIHIAWLNDKVAAKQKAITVRGNLELLLIRKNLDIAGISEANIWKEDEPADYKIKGFDIVSDKLFSTSGRARTALYINNKIKYDIRENLMDLQEANKNVEKILIGTT